MDARHVQRSLPLLAEQLGLARATEVMVRNPLVLAAPMASLQVHVPVLVELLGQDGVGDVLANANIKQLLREFSADESTSGPRQVRVSAAREREREREREDLVDSHGRLTCIKPPPMRPGGAIPVEYHTVLCWTVLWREHMPAAGLMWKTSMQKIE